MTPVDLERIGKRIYGTKHWPAKLALNLGINVSTLWRHRQREKIPYLVEVAVRGLADRHRQLVELERAENERLRALGIKRPRLRRKKGAKKRVKKKPMPEIIPDVVLTGSQE